MFQAGIEIFLMSFIRILFSNIYIPFNRSAMGPGAVVQVMYSESVLLQNALR